MIEPMDKSRVVAALAALPAEAVTELQRLADEDERAAAHASGPSWIWRTRDKTAHRRSCLWLRQLGMGPVLGGTNTRSHLLANYGIQGYNRSV